MTKPPLGKVEALFIFRGCFATPSRASSRHWLPAKRSQAAWFFDPPSLFEALAASMALTSCMVYRPAEPLRGIGCQLGAHKLHGFSTRRASLRHWLSARRSQAAWFFDPPSLFEANSRRITFAEEKLVFLYWLIYSVLDAEINHKKEKI